VAACLRCNRDRHRRKRPLSPEQWREVCLEVRRVKPARRAKSQPG
jgi:hypothetical protein